MTYRVGDEAKPGDVYVKGPVELRCGDYREVLADVEPDAVITDPPYADRVEGGFRTNRNGARSAVGMGYEPIDDRWCMGLWLRWRAVPGWLVVCCDHEAWRWHDRGAAAVGRMRFAPVVIVKSGYAPRMVGDGPASGCEYMCVARPRNRHMASWGALPGWYPMDTVRAGHGHCGVSGAKSVAFMRAIVRDYSRPDDLVCDPCAGGATTLIAAALEGRRAIGAELDPKTFAKACSRIERTALTPPLPFAVEGTPMKQEGLF